MRLIEIVQEVKKEIGEQNLHSLLNGDKCTAQIAKEMGLDIPETPITNMDDFGMINLLINSSQNGICYIN